MLRSEARGAVRPQVAHLPLILALASGLSACASVRGVMVPVSGTVAGASRVDMLVATTQWRRFGLPAGLYSAFDATHGIHAGDIETSLMLYFRPDLVDMSKAKLFPSKAAAMEKDYTHLRPAGQHGFGWIAQDINPDGAVGDASAATAEKGRLTAEHQADGFIALLRDVARFPLEGLA